MSAEEFIRTREFDTAMSALDRKIDRGFESVHERFNTLEPEVLEHAKQIAVLEFQAEQARNLALKARSEVRESRHDTRNSAAAWGSGAAGLAWICFEIAKAAKALWTGH